MQAPLITPLLSTQPATPGAKAQPAAAAAFGDMLSRELGNRQAPRGEATQRPTQAAPALPERGRQPARAATAAGGTGADAASTRMRQENQRAQDQRDNATQAHARAADHNQAAGAAGANAVNPTGADSANRSAGPALTSTAKANDKTAGRDDADASDTASTAGAETNAAGAANAADAAGAASNGAAAAALLALVNSLAPRPAPPSAPAVADGPEDPKLAAQKSTALLSIASPELAGDETAASDPAFDALLAQASQAREAVRGAGAGSESKPPPGLPQAAAANISATAAVPVDLATKVEAALAQPTSAQAAFERDAGHLLDAAAPFTATAIGTAATAGVLPGGNPDTAESLAPRVGTPAWDNALGQKVVWMAAGAEQSASLTLNPPDLGPLQVVINVSNSHAEATFTAAQPEVRQALEAAMPKLKEMLADAGISLGQTSVGAGSADPGSGQQQAAQTRRAGSADTPGMGADGAATQPLRTNRRGTAGNGLVDTFA